MSDVKELTQEEKEKLILEALLSEEGKEKLALTMANMIRDSIRIYQSMPLEVRIFASEEEKQKFIKEIIQEVDELY